MYASVAPWDVDGPQPAFAEAADEIRGAILDAGCGTGENALYFAGLGRKVTGFDFLAEPIARAKRKAAERNRSVDFHVRNAVALADWTERFDSVIDSGLFHVFSDDDRHSYVKGLTAVVKPGGKLFLLCFSEEEPGEFGPRRVTQQEIREAFADGWEVESIAPHQFAIRADFTAATFSPGGPKAWFAIVRRKS
jgi:cyclopropane fatty-acyl-phospholipid synthase-like methyltransferase